MGREHTFFVWVAPFLPRRRKEIHLRYKLAKLNRRLPPLLLSRPPPYHSATVRGIVESTIVAATSTNGTPMTAARKRPGSMFMAAPTRRPPALRPSHDSLDASAMPPPPAPPRPTSHEATSTKSSNVRFFVRYLADSYQGRPSSPPPSRSVHSGVMSVTRRCARRG